jgi:hypothetical protein
MTQENLEGLYAIDVTKGLASSETIYRLLKTHSPTCGVQKLIVGDGYVERYGDYNWRNTGVCASTYVSAMMRHINAWRDGEDIDPESGMSHVAHVACCCNIIIDALHCGTLDDDRNKIPAPKAAEDTLTFAMGPDDELIQYSIPEGWVWDAVAPKYYFTDKQGFTSGCNNEIQDCGDECYCGHRLVRDHNGVEICENCENYYNL